MTDTKRNEREKEDKTEKVLRDSERDGKQGEEETKRCMHFSGSNLHLSSASFIHPSSMMGGEHEEEKRKQICWITKKILKYTQTNLRN